MSEESIDFILSAQDNASAVFRETAVSAELMRDKIEQVGKNSKQGAAALEKMAHAVGAGWIADGANELKNLAGAGKDAMAALKGGGTAALVMKAGLVGLVAYGSFKVGKMISDWIWNTKAAREEMERLTAVFQKSTARGLQEEQRKHELARRNFDLLQTTAEKEEAAKQKEIELETVVLNKTKQLDRLRGKVSEDYIKNSEKSIEQYQAELDFYKEFNSEGEKQYRQKVATIEAEQNALKEREANQKKLFEMARDFQKEITNQFLKQEKEKEQAAKKRQAEEIRLAKESIGSLESQIQDLESIRVETSAPGLTGKDERLTVGRAKVLDSGQQQVELSKRQIKIAELQQKLTAEIARYTKLSAERKDEIVSLVGG